MAVSSFYSRLFSFYPRLPYKPRLKVLDGTWKSPLKKTPRVSGLREVLNENGKSPLKKLCGCQDSVKVY